MCFSSDIPGNYTRDWLRLLKFVIHQIFSLAPDWSNALRDQHAPAETGEYPSDFALDIRLARKKERQVEILKPFLTYPSARGFLLFFLGNFCDANRLF